MPHVSLVSMSGCRVRDEEVASMGMSLPGLRSRANAIAALPPLGLLTLGALTPPDWDVTLHESPAVTDDLVQEILNDHPEVVAISALTASILDAYELCDRLRAEGLLVVLGGLHVTACPEEAMLHGDAVVIGDGEVVWTDVLRDAERGRLRERYQNTRPFELGAAPLPRYDLLGRATRPRYTVQTSRGCPFACEFCGASRLLGAFRTKPAERIGEELDAIKAIDPHATIELADDNTFALGGAHDELLDVLGASGLKWFTECDWRLGENPQVLVRLADAGCVQVLVGIESLVHEASGMGAKRASIARMMDGVRAIQDAGVCVIGCFIIGCDGETHESIDRLRAFLLDDPCGDVQLTLQTPFPGTGLRRRLEHSGRLLADRDWSHHTLFDVTYQPDAMGVDELQSAFNGLLGDVFDRVGHDRRRSIRRALWERHPSLRRETT